VFYLNDVELGGEIIFDNGQIIKPKKGSLIIFPEDSKYSYKCKLPKSNTQYIITGQLCNENIIT
jgi:hypothetical protein